MPDLPSLRAALRPWCDCEALERLELSHVTVDPRGPVRLLLEGPGPDGKVVRLAARRLDPDEGARVAREMNRGNGGRVGEPGAFGGFAQPAIYLRELELLFHVFPTDRDLPSLPAAADGRMMAPILEARLAERTGGCPVRDVVVELLRYKPERKCLLRYDIRWAPGEPPRCPAIVYARVSRRTKFDRIRDVLPGLHVAAAGLLFRLPEPLGIVPELDMGLFGSVPGIRLFRLARTEAFPALCAGTGIGLAEFHALPITFADERDTAAKVESIIASAAEFTWLIPAQQERLVALRHELVARLESLPPSRPRPIHGDFHGDNVLVDGARLALVDLEDCAMGDPADDVASNWAQLTWHTIKAGRSTPIPEAGRRAFLDAYLGRTDAETAARVPVHAAMHCFLYAYQCLRHPQDADRYDDAEAKLGACEDVLAGRLP
jgi:hypothetical protein